MSQSLNTNEEVESSNEIISYGEITHVGMDIRAHNYLVYFDSKLSGNNELVAIPSWEISEQPNIGDLIEVTIVNDRVTEIVITSSTEGQKGTDTARKETKNSSVDASNESTES